MRTENGLLGVGTAPPKGEEDSDLINAGKQPPRRQGPHRTPRDYKGPYDHQASRRCQVAFVAPHRANRKPRLLDALSGVFELRAATR